MSVTVEIPLDANGEPDFSMVPADFPKPAYTSALPGAQVKFSATKFGDKYYAAGTSPVEVFERWYSCEDYSHRLAASAKVAIAGKASHFSEAELLGKYIPQLIATRSASASEVRWVIRRTAAILGWPVPDEAREVEEAS
jgi:hypothetical protein